MVRTIFIKVYSPLRNKKLNSTRIEITNYLSAESHQTGQADRWGNSLSKTSTNGCRFGTRGKGLI